MIKFLFQVLLPFKFLILGQLTVGIIWAIDLSLRPYLLKVIIDRLPSLHAEDVSQQLSVPIAFYLGMSLLIVVIFRIYDFIWLKLNPPLKRHVGNILIKKMMSHSITLFQDQFAGNLANKIKDAMSGIPDILKLIINQFL